ncbi:MAG: hypothetical protein ACD_5C00246G0001 [uncultured bacterium]|nr:MAG: hypothetical protein ACD_5C00246G0001 [uncultured bacterium]
MPEDEKHLLDVMERKLTGEAEHFIKSLGRTTLPSKTSLPKTSLPSSQCVSVVRRQKSKL